MKAILIGGSGLIGKAVAQELLGRGHTVTVLSRRPAEAVVPAGAAVRGWDGRSAAGWSDLAEEADALVNLAGENIGGGLWTAQRKQRILASRLRPSRRSYVALHCARSRATGSVVGNTGFDEGEHRDRREAAKLTITRREVWFRAEGTRFVSR